MHIPLVYEHIFYKYFVRRSVGQATKSKRASLLMDVVILVYFIILAIATLFIHIDVLVKIKIMLLNYQFELV